MQKHVNLVDLVKSSPTNIYLQNLASIQKRTSYVKFAHLAEKSGNGSIPNLSTKVLPGQPGAKRGGPRGLWARRGLGGEAAWPAGLRCRPHRLGATPILNRRLRPRNHRGAFLLDPCLLLQQCHIIFSEKLLRLQSLRSTLRKDIDSAMILDTFSFVLLTTYGA